jgi:protein TonB
MSKVVNHLSIILIFLFGILNFDTLSAQNTIKPHPSERNDIFIVCEDMPRFPGCEDIEGNNEVKRRCSEQKMLDYIYSNLEYPAEALRNIKEGKVILKVVINTEGIIEYIQVVSSPDLSFSKAAEKVVLSMNEMPERWKPGIQRGKVVDVWYQFRICFTLDDENEVYKYCKNSR